MYCELLWRSAQSSEDEILTDSIFNPRNATWGVTSHSLESADFYDEGESFLLVYVFDIINKLFIQMPFFNKSINETYLLNHRRSITIYKHQYDIRLG